MEKSQLFDANVLELNRAYLVGWWQSEKYFASVKDEVIKAFTFKKNDLSIEMQKYKEQMQQIEQKETVQV